jgi:hypothetical protein
VVTGKLDVCGVVCRKELLEEDNERDLEEVVDE